MTEAVSINQEKSGQATTQRLAQSKDESLIYGDGLKYPVILRPDPETAKPNPKEFFAKKDSAPANIFKLKVRIMNALGTILIPAILLIILKSVKGRMRLSTFIGLMIWSLYFVYYSAFFYIFCSGKREGKNLYRIVSISSVTPAWAAMDVTSHQILFPYNSIGSISEFSAILGGIPNILLNSITAYTWTFLMMHYAVQLVIYRDEFGWDLSDACIIIGSLGLLLIGIFEIGYVHDWQANLHVIGVFLSGLIFLGYILQQQSIGRPTWWLSIVIGTIGSGLFIGWKYVRHVSDKLNAQHTKAVCNPDNPQNPKQFKELITKRSLMNVTTEAVMMIFVSLALGLWFLDYDEHCNRGCCCDKVEGPTRNPTMYPTLFGK